MSFTNIKYQRIADIEEDMTSVQLLNPSDKSVLQSDDPSMYSDSRNTFCIGEDSTQEDGGGSRKYKQLGVLYKFTPTNHVPRLRLFDSNSSTGSLKSIIRKNCLIVITETRGDWNYIIYQEFEGWCQFSLRDEKIREALKPLEEYPRYWEWRGEDVFCCNGKLMFGSDFKLFIFTNILYVSASFIFIISVVPHMYEPELVMVSYLFQAYLDITNHTF